MKPAAAPVRAETAGGRHALDLPCVEPGERLRGDFRKLGDLPELVPPPDSEWPCSSGKRRAIIRFASAAPCWGGDDTPAWLDMAGADLSFLNTGRAPLLLDHCRDVRSLVGVVERAWIEGDAAYALVRFAESTARARQAWNLMRERVLVNVSMGLYLLRQELTDPLMAARVRWWRPYEVSLCTVPADWTAHVWRVVTPSSPVRGDA